MNWMTPSIGFIIAGISGAMTVILGAFAAHGLKHRLDEYSLAIWEKASYYQMTHTLLILCFAVLLKSSDSIGLKYGILFATLGIFLFSGSLYGLSVTSAKWLGPITPLGGLCFIAAWCSLAFAAVKGL